MKLRENPTPEQCAASRCKDAPTETHDVPGVDPTRFCARHGTEARAEYLTMAIAVEILPLEPPTALATVTLPAVAKPTPQENADLTEALKMVQAFEIVTAEDVAFAEEGREEARQQWNDYEARRTKITKPLNEGLREANALFRPVLTTLKSIQDEWSRKLVARKLAKDAERAALIEEARATEEPEILRETLVAASDAKIETASLKFIDRWRFEVVDPALVPAEFLAPDLVKIGGVVEVLKDKTAIPGIRVWNDPYTSA